MLTQIFRSVHLRCMKTIITFTFGLLLAVSTLSTASAQVYSNSYYNNGYNNTYTNCGGNVTLYPYVSASLGCGNNYTHQNNYNYPQTQTVYSYYYTSGCYTYYYDGVSRTSSVSSYNCQTQPTYSYNQPTNYTYYTQPTYTYSTYPSYYNSGYTNTGYYNNRNYNYNTYDNGFVYTPQTNCYSSNGYYVCQ